MKDRLVNEQIKSSRVDVVCEGNFFENVSIKKALQMAYDRDLDLIQMSKNGNKVICKISDFGKMKYEASKKEKTKKQNNQIVKESKVKVNISQHDLAVKHKQIQKWLEKKYKVKYTLEVRGREISVFKDKMQDILSEHLSIFENIAKITTIQKDNRRITVLIENT